MVLFAIFIGCDIQFTTKRQILETLLNKNKAINFTKKKWKDIIENNLTIVQLIKSNCYLLMTNVKCCFSAYC